MVVVDGKLDMFNVNETVNLLHKDGTAYYYGTIMPNKEANRYFDLLLKNAYLEFVRTEKEYVLGHLSCWLCCLVLSRYLCIGSFVFICSF